MSSFKTRLLTNWHAIRVFKLGVGITAVAEGIYFSDAAIGLLGVFFLYQSVTNSACCGTAACFVKPNTKNDMVDNSN